MGSSGQSGSPTVGGAGANRTNKLVKTFRSQAPQIKKLLDKLDEADSGEGNREDDTFSYRKTAVMMVPHSEEERVPYLIATRRIGCRSLSFLFGGFVHSQTEVLIRLTTLFGAWCDHTGGVEQCRHVEGNIHEVILKFDKPIDPAAYCASAVSPRVLLVEDDRLIEKLAKTYLSDLNAEVDHAPNGEVAVKLAMENLYDVVLMDMEMPVMDGYTAVKTLREKGYIGTIVATTGRTQPADRERCLDAGCDHYIPKPYSRESLAGLIQSLQEEPVYSDYEEDPSMREVIAMCITDLPARIRAIEEAITADDADAAEKALRSLKAIVGGCGFAVIADAAAMIEQALIDGQPLDQLRSKITALVRLCLRARSTARASQMDAG